MNPLAALISELHQKNVELQARLDYANAEAEKQRELAEHWKGRYRETQQGDSKPEEGR